ncbi:MAG: hypothetical protein OXP73_05980 [Chloroflexota bacterium]|nr:hypothetical protein [Chloroflexota bacterium]
MLAYETSATAWNADAKHYELPERGDAVIATDDEPGRAQEHKSD